MHLTVGLEPYREGGSLSYGRLDLDITSHLLNKHLTDRETEASARRICFLMTSQISEITEEFVKLVLWDSSAIILHANLELGHKRSEILTAFSLDFLKAHSELVEFFVIALVIAVPVNLSIFVCFN